MIRDRLSFTRKYIANPPIRGESCGDIEGSIKQGKQTQELPKIDTGVERFEGTVSYLEGLNRRSLKVSLERLQKEFKKNKITEKEISEALAGLVLEANKFTRIRPELIMRLSNVIQEGGIQGIEDINEYLGLIRDDLPELLIKDRSPQSGLPFVGGIITDAKNFLRNKTNTYSFIAKNPLSAYFAQGVASIWNPTKTLYNRSAQVAEGFVNLGDVIVGEPTEKEIKAIEEKQSLPGKIMRESVRGLRKFLALRLPELSVETLPMTAMETKIQSSLNALSRLAVITSLGINGINGYTGIKDTLNNIGAKLDSAPIARMQQANQVATLPGVGFESRSQINDKVKTKISESLGRAIGAVVSEVIQTGNPVEDVSRFVRNVATNSDPVKALNNARSIGETGMTPTEAQKVIDFQKYLQRPPTQSEIKEEESRQELLQINQKRAAKSLPEVVSKKEDQVRANWGLDKPQKIISFVESTRQDSFKLQKIIQSKIAILESQIPINQSITQQIESKYQSKLQLISSLESANQSIIENWNVIESGKYLSNIREINIQKTELADIKTELENRNYSSSSVIQQIEQYRHSIQKISMNGENLKYNFPKNFDNLTQKDKQSLVIQNTEANRVALINRELIRVDQWIQDNFYNPK